MSNTSENVKEERPLALQSQEKTGVNMQNENTESQAFHILGEEADRLKALVQKMNPHLKTLRRSMDKLDKMIKTSSVKHDSRAKRLTCELQLLKPYLTQSRNDMSEVWSDLKSLLHSMGKDLPNSGVTAVQQKDIDGATPQEEEDDSDDDMEDFSPDFDALDNCSEGDAHLRSPHEENETHSLEQHSRAFERIGHHREIHKQVENERSKFNLLEDHMNKPTKRSSSRQRERCEQKVAPAGPSVCELCGKECKNASILKKHKYHLHTSERPWMCEVCGKSFRSKQSATHCKHSKRKMVALQKCKVCGEDFKNIGSLRVHLRLAHSLPHAQKFPCLLCDESFTQGKELRDHLALHTQENGEPLLCKICGKDFKDPTSLRNHLLRHKNKSHSCNICGKTCMDTMTWRHHKDSHSKQVSCQVCGRILSSACRLKEHMNIHTGDKPIECDVCHKKLPTRSALKNHKARMHNKGNVGNKCVICGEVFKTNFARNSHHLLKHTEEERKQHNVVVKMFMCDFCGKTLRLEYKTSHLNKHKNKNEIRHVCDICGKGFVRLSLLKMHIGEHKDAQGERVLTEEERGTLETSLQFENEYELKHECDVCGKKFRFVNSLAYHKKIHTQVEKPYRCESCGKLFKFEHRLRAHERRHLGEEQVHMCEICGKGFPRYVQLQSHLITHSDFRPYSCPVCELGFKHHKNMLRHIRLVHKGERRFTCDVCGKSFGTRSVLKIHSRIHTGEKPYSCEICGHSFSDPSTLYKHRLLHSKREPEPTVVFEADLADFLVKGEFGETTILVLS
ncbi:zinc finger protein 26 [Elysia marginata]|uniref:Zinc finger protein 26 n=1 Tax=Elysia marginata TaxID=1093978 RepID=A0AAV4JDP5_9GAST|nr:zinc finger protein 26 [Elysia marginata]